MNDCPPVQPCAPGLFAYLEAREDTAVRRNPVPRGAGSATPRRAGAAWCAAGAYSTHPAAGANPAEVDALLGALHRPGPGDGPGQARPGGLRRMEVLGLRWAMCRPVAAVVYRGGQGRRSAANCPISSGFSPPRGRSGTGTTGDRDREGLRSAQGRRGLPLSAAGLDEILDGARVGPVCSTAHGPTNRRTLASPGCGKPGMALEAIQAQAGHASIQRTRTTYLANGDGPTVLTARPRPSSAN